MKISKNRVTAPFIKDSSMQLKPIGGMETNRGKH